MRPPAPLRSLTARTGISYITLSVNASNRSASLLPGSGSERCSRRSSDTSPKVDAHTRCLLHVSFPAQTPELAAVQDHPSLAAPYSRATAGDRQLRFGLILGPLDAEHSSPAAPC